MTLVELIKCHLFGNERHVPYREDDDDLLQEVITKRDEANRKADRIRNMRESFFDKPFGESQFRLDEKRQ